MPTTQARLWRIDPALNGSARRELLQAKWPTLRVRKAKADACTSSREVDEVGQSTEMHP